MPKVLGGRYELGERLGAGGMADVFEGYDTRLARRVAVKILRAELPDDRTRARFEQEARLAARFSHPNAVAATAPTSSWSWWRGRRSPTCCRTAGHSVRWRPSRSCGRCWTRWVRHTPRASCIVTSSPAMSC
ncbi:MAG: hypothetical protein E6G60_06655 [Actinobacteria bacterium]|nr:MAG: hypothetical protein E6G60_06655 [Actinomycetota bacterium]